jgi:protein-S-isoprenylcysteine O-methyltransferase Ste14
MRSFPDLPPVWTVGFGLLAWALARYLPLASFGWGAVPGIALIAGGVALIGWSAIWFWRRRTPIEPHEMPRVLISEGPYRLNRNPIYTGLAAILFGWAFWLGAVTAFLPAMALPFVLAARFVRSEEEALRTMFGSEAEAYFRRTRRW